VCPTTCAVCGLKAIGYNYNVASCQGCKSFFRRSVEQKRRFVCEKPDECEENRDGDKPLRCRACRFERCIRAGMDVRAVGASKGWLSRRAANAVTTTEAPSAMTLIPAPVPMESVIDRVIEEFLHLELSHQKLRRSRYNPSFPPPRSLEWCLNGPSLMGIQFGDMPVPYPPHQPPVPFVPMEDALLHRIVVPPFPACYVPPATFKMWMMVDLVYTIEWLKTLPFMRKFNHSDKIRLASNVTQAVTYITAAFDAYDTTKSDVTVMPDGTVICKGLEIKESTVEHNKWFGIISRLKELQVDKREYVLLKAIMACDP
ncbi:hypothetical protein PMAYCL1PPCAC_16914, partial [Pristionchus mayeri]